MTLHVQLHNPTSFFYASMPIKKNWEVFVLFLGLLWGVYAYYPSLINPYVIADDVRVCTYWIAQYQDRELFQDDLLTIGTQFGWPWGFQFLYYLSSFVSDPFFFGTLLTIFLLAISALFLYKIGEHIHGSFVGFLSALLFLMTPMYLSRMAGGLPRTFGYPLIILFLYYLIQKKYFQTLLVLILQCLFYPMIFLVSILTYAMTFLGDFQNKRLWSPSFGQLKYFGASVFICGLLLMGKHGFSQDPQIGKPFTRETMVKMPEFYRHVGRWYDLLPILPVFQEVEKNIMEGNMISGLMILHSKGLPPALRKNCIRLIFGLALFFLVIEIVRKKVIFPREILFLFLASVLFYRLADYLLFQLYVPSRYVIFTVPLMGLLIFAVALELLLGKIKPLPLRRVVQIGILLFLLLSVRFDRNSFLIDETPRRDLYRFLSDLPKDALIAAHPHLADNIPAFSKRKVFVNDETAVPLYDTYWNSVKKRLFEFFNLYYADNPLFMYQYCVQKGIDYMVVRGEDFEPSFLARKQFYFYPFNPFIVEITEKRKDFVLKQIPDEFKIFQKDHLYVIPRESLLMVTLRESNRGRDPGKDQGQQVHQGK